MSYRYRGVFEFILYFTKPGSSKFTGDGYFKYDHIMLDEKSEVFRYPRLHGSNKVHTAEKPVRLYESFILDSSDPGDLIIDPFAGSGPIIDACKNTGRRYIAMELNPDYINGPDGMLDREKQVSVFEKIPTPKEPQQVDIEQVQDLRSQREDDASRKEIESDMEDVRDMFGGNDCDPSTGIRNGPSGEIDMAQKEDDPSGEIDMIQEGDDNDENVDRDDIVDKE